ncbi:MAG: kelch repeat-containing protein, partial [Opitutaceae bacterium]
MILTAVFAGAAPGWNVAGALATAREEQTATLLPSGKVLVAGGFNGSSAIGSAELYDPSSGAWSAAGSLAAPRYFQTATLLTNGKVLVAGGLSGGAALASAELYDPENNTWSPAG